MDVVVRVARDCVRRRELGAQPRRRSGLEADDPGRRVAALGGMTKLRRQPVVVDDAIGISAGDPDVGDVAPARSEAGGDRCGAGGAGATPRALDGDDPRVCRRRAAGALGRAVSTAVGGDDREDVHIVHECRHAVDRAQAARTVATSSRAGTATRTVAIGSRSSGRGRRTTLRSSRTSFGRPLAVGAGDRSTGAACPDVTIRHGGRATVDPCASRSPEQGLIVYRTASRGRDRPCCAR